jgi:hypothetical protein
MSATRTLIRAGVTSTSAAPQVGAACGRVATHSSAS